MTNLKILLILLLLAGCSAKNRVYQSGPRGGCYYVTTSGEKQYVDKSNCLNQQSVKSEDDRVSNEGDRNLPSDVC